MKTKRKNFGSFFVRIGAGFLAFWLVVMGAFTLLMGQQRAKLIEADAEKYSNRFTDNFAEYMLDSTQHSTDDPEELRKMLKNSIFEFNTPEVPIVEVAVTDQNGKVLQSNRWWLTLRDDEENDYFADMGEQPKNVCEAILSGTVVTDSGMPLPDISIEAWVDGDQAYLKTVTLRPNKAENGIWVPTGEVNTVECPYDENKVKDLPLKTLTCTKVSSPSWGVITPEEIAATLCSPARLALREWAENPSSANSSEEIVRPWLVRKFYRRMKHCDYVDGGYVMLSFAAEGYPLKACLPTLVSAGAMSFVLAMLCAVILSFALLRVWRRQERVEQMRRETTAALAHELKTPLSVLSATAELLGDNLATEKRAHYLAVIQTQAQRMDSSVRKMLELSRLETGAQALRRGEFSLAELAQERLAAALPADSSLHTEFASDDEYMVNADRALLTRALDALLENAVQHTPEGGCIAIRIADGTLSVTNTGDVIPNHALPRLWEAYYQADPSRSTKGDGLGLSIAKTVFDLHGYTCGAENTDAGPKFWFKFA